MNLNAILFQIYTSVQIHIASKCTKLPSYQMWKKPVHAKDLVLTPKLTHTLSKFCYDEFIFNRNVNLFTELNVGVAKWIFCYKDGILMETDPFSANLCGILNILL